uniref:UDENN domain-containing protein n=1 Tax=Kalmanozyma brasiliensis (strain GHG001) TaxID=1365824 RepID=V5EJP1_KALBG
MSIDDSASELAVASTAMSSNNGYCTFCLLAEFDIDRGSTLSHQYPAPTGYDEHMLAELMLPDGVHARTEDWTFFFLKPPGHKRAASSEGSDDAASSDPSSWLSDDLTYVINLVRTKHDNTVRRGALVKAMAIGTRYPFIEIFKPALLLALDDYFKEPGPDCLARLYDAINRLDLSAAPSFSRAEKLVLRGSDRRDLFEERPRDTHFFDTVLTYRNVPLPIRVPLTTFPEEVGEYSLIRLIQTFSGPQSTPTGPTHPHLHTNGPSTHPIIVLFNALVTQKRVIFLGYGQPANLVASFVLAACALGSGCGVVLQGFAARAFPYTNLLNLDDLEKVPGYIAGVTNPRFEDLRAWDVLLNVETGRIQVAKDIAPAPHPTSTPSQALLRSATLPRDGAGVSSSNNFGSVSSHGGTATPDLELAQFGALPTASSAAVSSGAASSKASSLGGPASRDRSNTSQSDSRSDPSNALFMEELQTAIAAHYGERFIRARVQEYVFFFVQRVTRHEEHFYGRTSLAPTCQPFLNGQLGSGPNYVDRDAEMREILSNQMRIEGFRSTIAYRLLVEQLNQHGGYTRAIRDFDVAHQIGRLRRARKLFAGEAELIYETIAKSVVTHDQIVEVLALLPPHTGGLLPLALGLFHPSPAARDAVVDFFLRLCRHPVGRKFVQSMHTYHRLAFARLAQDRAEAEMASAAKAEAQSVRSSTQTAPRTSSLPSSQIKDADSSNGDTRSPVDRNSASTTAAKSVDAELAAADGMEEPSYMSSLRGSNHPFKSFSPVRETAAS